MPSHLLSHRVCKTQPRVSRDRDAGPPGRRRKLGCREGRKEDAKKKKKKKNGHDKELQLGDPVSPFPVALGVGQDRR
jgi:hypothetical protein